MHDVSEGSLRALDGKAGAQFQLLQSPESSVLSPESIVLIRLDQRSVRPALCRDLVSEIFGRPDGAVGDRRPTETPRHARGDNLGKGSTPHTTDPLLRKRDSGANSNHDQLCGSLQPSFPIARPAAKVGHGDNPDF